MDLIDRQEAIKAINNVLMEDDQYKVWLKIGINNLKTVDAIPVSFIQKRIQMNKLSEMDTNNSEEVRMVFRERRLGQEYLIEGWRLRQDLEGNTEQEKQNDRRNND